MVAHFRCRRPPLHPSPGKRRRRPPPPLPAGDLIPAGTRAALATRFPALVPYARRQPPVRWDYLSLLKQIPVVAEVVVAERVPAVVEWNPEHLGRLASQPIEDARTRVRVADVRLVLKRVRTGFDAILLDVDNRPKGLTRRENDWLYSFPGLNAAFDALRPRGVLAIWSAGPDGGFANRLRQVGFDAEETGARAHGPNNGSRHTIWLATRPV